MRAEAQFFANHPHFPADPVDGVGDRPTSGWR
jgi:hypothetical protein